MPGGLTFGDGIEHLFLVDEDEHSPLYRVPKPRAFGAAARH